ncbi:hypothetical protein NBRC10513_000670 [Rhodotorula toruloides]
MPPATTDPGADTAAPARPPPPPAAPVETAENVVFRGVSRETRVKYARSLTDPASIDLSQLERLGFCTYVEPGTETDYTIGAKVNKSPRSPGQPKGRAARSRTKAPTATRTGARAPHEEEEADETAGSDLETDVAVMEWSAAGLAGHGKLRGLRRAEPGTRKKSKRRSRSRTKTRSTWSDEPMDLDDDGASASFDAPEQQLHVAQSRPSSNATNLPSRLRLPPSVQLTTARNAEAAGSSRAISAGPTRGVGFGETAVEFVLKIPRVPSSFLSSAASAPLDSPAAQPSASERVELGAESGNSGATFGQQPASSPPALLPYSPRPLDLPKVDLYGIRLHRQQQIQLARTRPSTDPAQQLYVFGRIVAPSASADSASRAAPRPFSAAETSAASSDSRNSAATATEQGTPPPNPPRSPSQASANDAPARTVLPSFEDVPSPHVAAKRRLDSAPFADEPAPKRPALPVRSGPLPFLPTYQQSEVQQELQVRGGGASSSAAAAVGPSERGKYFVRISNLPNTIRPNEIVEIVHHLQQPGLPRPWLFHSMQRICDGFWCIVMVDSLEEAQTIIGE